MGNVDNGMSEKPPNSFSLHFYISCCQHCRAGRAALASAVAAEEDALRDREPSFLRLRDRRWLDSALREEGGDIRSSVERVRG